MLANILVVDDELGPREALKMILKDEYNVVTASNGSQAMEYLSSQDFALVILDIRMPDISGVDLLKKIKIKAKDTEVLMITAYASVNTATEALRYGALDYLIKPFDAGSVKKIVKKGLGRRDQSRSIRLKLDELQHINETLKNEIETAYENIRKHYLETVNSLIAAIDAKDSYTKGHQERVAELALKLGEAMCLSSMELLLLKQASILHDIGKIGIPEEILQKKATLTIKEYDLTKQHPLIGAKIISPVKSLSDVIPIVLHHHERYDGTGYPQGLKEKEIPIGAQIIAVADAIDAMLSNRPYSPAKSVQEVREELKRFSGIQFAPKIVDLALKINLQVDNYLYHTVTRSPDKKNK